MSDKMTAVTVFMIMWGIWLLLTKHWILLIIVVIYLLLVLCCYLSQSPAKGNNATTTTTSKTRSDKVDHDFDPEIMNVINGSHKDKH